MKTEKIKLSNKTAEGYVVPFGPVNLVFARTDEGTVGCGIFDVETFQKFGFPAAKVKANKGLVENIEDLLLGEVVAMNPSAESLGISLGMSGKEALERM